MKYILFFLLYFHSQKIIAQEFYIKNVSAINLEEDKDPFATFNDEICVITALYSVKNDSLYYLKTSPILNFTDSIKTQNVNFNFNLANDTSSNLIIALIELDNNLSEDSLSNLFLTTFKTYRFHPKNFLLDNLRTKLNDDDLLGLLQLNFKQILKQEELINFKGMHLFNKYHYQLSLSQ